MFTLLAAALAALSSLTYWLRYGTLQMPYWLMVASTIGSLAVAELAEELVRRHRIRVGRSRRRAHARPAGEHR
ncbi:hypothetical protein ACFW9D_05875 [Streptomyces sp. NPDC059524]|uniref:hypothetical protein n=1 Tax=Streptomyces sp. NPDC059524 TaxID=3346856 RepID=UPI0036949C6D